MPAQGKCHLAALWGSSVSAICFDQCEAKVSDRELHERVRGKWCLSWLALNLWRRYRFSGHNNTNIVLSRCPYALMPFKALPYSDVTTVLIPQYLPLPLCIHKGVSKWLHADVMSNKNTCCVAKPSELRSSACLRSNPAYTLKGMIHLKTNICWKCTHP